MKDVIFGTVFHNFIYKTYISGKEHLLQEYFKCCFLPTSGKNAPVFDVGVQASMDYFLKFRTSRRSHFRTLTIFISTWYSTYPITLVFSFQGPSLTTGPWQESTEPLCRSVKKSSILFPYLRQTLGLLYAVRNKLCLVNFTLLFFRNMVLETEQSCNISPEPLDFSGKLAWFCRKPALT
jgi:hypothetical protein